MAEFVKKGTLGGYKAVNAGHSDPECSHVILTVKEYDDLLAKIRSVDRTAQEIKEQARYKINQAKEEATTAAQKASETADRQVRAMQVALDKEKAAVAYEKGLNANLLRIAKERANADRKLRPKKEHTGYVVTYSAEKPYKYKERRNLVTVMLWETVLQSPYSVDFTKEQAVEQMQELFRKDENGAWLIQKIGINANYGGAYEDMISDKDWTDWASYNVLLEPRYRANYKAGYWELVFYHTKPLGIVPPEMRP